MRFKSFIFISALLGAAWNAGAATLVGDQITQQISNLDGDFISDTLTVGNTSSDLTNSIINFDFAAGAAGDEYLVTSIAGSWCGFLSCSGLTTTISLSDLDFSGGEILIGFDVLSSYFPLTVSIDSSSALSLSFTEGDITGLDTFVFIDGRFLTAPLRVPEPATLALLGIALAGLAFRRRAS